MLKAAITAVHGYVPDYILTNAELETMVETNDEWIVSRTGIKERRILKDEDKATGFLGTKVAQGLLEKSGTNPEDIDLVILATVTPDYYFPDTANTICDHTGMSKAFAYDIHAACSGFLFALFTGAQFISSGAYKKVMVIGADKMSSIVDYKDRSTCIIFGDGGAGVILEPDSDGFGIQDAVLKGDGQGRHYLHMKAGGALKGATHETVDNREHFVFQDGRPVFKAAVSGMSKAIKELLERNNMGVEDVDWIVPHQANLRIITAVANQLDFDMEKVTVNIQKYGNTTDGTIPLCLWEWQSIFKEGQNIVLTAFGGGFTWGALLLKWKNTKTK